MWTIERLVSHRTQCEIDGVWIPSRPLIEPFLWRLRDAWAVLVGRADAFIWPGGQ